ncbi:MAG TPA: hypothetical protein VIC35_13460 [Acidimicrobiia bacterium]|jgi:hypothetical protein
MRARSTVLILALLGSAVLAACGSGAAPKPGATTAPPTTTTTRVPRHGLLHSLNDRTLCKVVTPIDAGLLFRASARRLVLAPRAGGAAASCAYDHPGDSLLLRRLLQVHVFPSAQYFGPQFYPGAVPLRGLGDRAFKAPAGPLRTPVVEFVKSNKTVSISYTNGAFPPRAYPPVPMLLLAGKVAAAL